jgi:hypothetical protein
MPSDDGYQPREFERSPQTPDRAFRWSDDPTQFAMPFAEACHLRSGTSTSQKEVVNDD